MALLCASAACAPTESETTDAPGSTTEAAETTTGAASTSTDPTTEVAPTSSGSEGETDAPATTTGETSTGSTGPTDTTGAPVGEYCQGFDAGALAPFLALFDLAEQPLVDGGSLPLECGGQGSWMFGLYPKLGGWDPKAELVVFDITVDVEGHNTNPAGHFYSSETSYYIGCEPVIGGVLGVAPVFPPDDLADLGALDGLPAQVHVEVDAGGQALVFDATMTLVAPPAVLAEGCIPKG